MDARNKKVIVPPEYENNEIKIPISRSAKRSSMVVGICADGTSIKPGLAIPRKTVELELMENGYTPDKNINHIPGKWILRHRCFHEMGARTTITRHQNEEPNSQLPRRRIDNS